MNPLMLTAGEVYGRYRRDYPALLWRITITCEIPDPQLGGTLMLRKFQFNRFPFPQFHRIRQFVLDDRYVVWDSRYGYDLMDAILRRLDTAP